MQVPLPKIPPIIVAAIAIPTNLGAVQLREYSEKILLGLLARSLPVVSYSHDGTEVERSVQRLLSERATDHRAYSVPSPAASSGGYDLRADVALFGDHPLVFVQDSMHARKTYRNNNYSGGSLTVLGNRTALYRRIREVAFEEGSPLYHRDVDKVDRQDDNAAMRLFSASMLEYLITHHPDYLGEIVYLFVFGELVDAWQNRHIPHIERIKMLLRAHYFVKMWTTYLERAKYPLRQYCISREALDITRILIESLFALIMIHRDYNAQHTVPLPFLPWLHSTEPCEHVFGEARQVVKDFTFLDFHIMIKKLMVKIWEAARLAEATEDPKARANGYNHTYLDIQGLDLCALATYPDDLAIQQAASDAFEEAASLMALLGVVPDQIHAFVAAAANQNSTSTTIPLDTHPTNGSFVPLDTDEAGDDDDDGDDDSDGDVYDIADSLSGEAEELHNILRHEEELESTGNARTYREDARMDMLAMAAVSMSMDDMCRMYVLHQLIVLSRS